MRKVKEIEFHNKREELRKTDPQKHDEYYTNRRFYKTTEQSKKFVEKWYSENCIGKQVLDYCCGSGGTSLRLAKIGINVTGIDISNESIATAKNEAKLKGLEQLTNFEVMDAEKLTFRDNSFDIIICNGVLHHLDLEQSYRELSRVLKSDGIVVAIEALGHNPIINWYRRITPHLRTAWEIDHILTLKQINNAKKYFKKINKNFFHLASIIVIPFINKPGFHTILMILNFIDSIILKIPGIQKLAWQVIFFMSEPYKNENFN
jgi:ubiquinone/menaquinone biosynthesis C-methylase UbiE